MAPKPKKYRKKPEIVEGYQVTDKNVHDVATWCGGQACFGSYPGTNEHLNGPNYILVSTLEGTRYVAIGNYIYKNSQGRIYVKTAPVFETLFEPEKPPINIVINNPYGGNGPQNSVNPPINI